MKHDATRGFTLIEMTIVTAVALAGLAITIAAIQVASRAVTTTVNAERPTDEAKARTKQLLESDLRDLDPFMAFVAAGGVATRDINESTVPRWSERALALPHKSDPTVQYKLENETLIREEGDRRQVAMRNIGEIASRVNLCARTVRLTFKTADDQPTRALRITLPLTGLLRMPVRENFNQPATWQHRYTQWHHQLALDATCAERLEELGTLLRLTNPNVPKIAPDPALHNSGGIPAAVFQTANDCLRIDKNNRLIFYCLEPPLGATAEVQANRVVRYERRSIPQLNPQNRFIPTFAGLRFWCGAINPARPTRDPEIDVYNVFFGDPFLVLNTSETVRNACWQLTNAYENGTEVTTRTVMEDSEKYGAITDIPGVRRLGKALLVFTLNTEDAPIPPSQDPPTADAGTRDDLIGVSVDGPVPVARPSGDPIALFVPVTPNDILDAQSVDPLDALQPLSTRQRKADTHCEVPVILREQADERQPGRRSFSQKDAERIWLHGIECSG